MKVISNQMLFDDSGEACGFTEPVIHSYSKGKSPEQFDTVHSWIEVGTCTKESILISRALFVRSTLSWLGS